MCTTQVAYITELNDESSLI